MGQSNLKAAFIKMQLHLLILAFGLCAVANALRFSTPSITVDTDAIIVGQPAKLTCNYVKFRTETVRGIGWYLSYEGFRSKIFHYHVTTGRKEPSIYSHVTTMEETATEKELTIVLPEFRSPTITLGCEVEVLRDSGYGKLDHSKKITEANISVADTQGHQLRIKNGKWDAYNSRNTNQHEATVGQPLLVSCISQGTTPNPNLTLFVNDQAWEDVSATARTQELTMGVPSGMKVVEGRLDMVYDSMFGRNDMIVIECKAHIQDYMLTSEHLSLRKKTNQIVHTNQGYQRPQRPVQVYDRNQEQPRRTQFDQDRGGRAYDDSVIHSRLLDLLDPAKHMHPGIPYDFYDGYILMVADNVDDDINNVNNNGYGGHRGNSRPVTTHLYGHLANEIIRDLQSSYGSFQTISNKKYMIKMNPVDILNQLGTHGYRVIGFTAESDKKMVWTLELRDFEQAHPQKQQQHQHNNRWN